MAANDFSKEERVAFEDVLEGFNDQLVISPMVSKYDMGAVAAERQLDTVWRPMPYIARSFDGLDQSSNFDGITQLSVPSTIGFHKSVPFSMTATELRDGIQRNRYIEAGKQKLASDINVALMNVASNEGSLFVKRTGAATGYDDVAEADALMNEQGIGMNDRYLCLASRSYNAMAGNLAARETMNDMPTKAYRKTYVGNVAGFETAKLDYANSLTAAAGVGVTVNGANQRHVPKAIDLTQSGQINVDNRGQTLAITVTSGTVKVGDALTIAGVNAVHHITKGDTGQLKTFRIVEILTGSGGTGTVKIYPAIVAADSSPTQAEVQYKNVTATPADGAAITFLNTTDGVINPFWHKDAIELLPSEVVVEENSGLAVMRGTTDQGLTVLMTRQGAIGDLGTKYRLDTAFGTVCCNPEMAGLMMFSQT